MMNTLLAETQSLGKPTWRAMLRYTAELHAHSTHPAQPPFPYDWEEIGPGYCYGPAFGHWDIIHQILDVLPTEPEHARCQLLNNFANQEPDGLLPGSIYIRPQNTVASDPPGESSQGSPGYRWSKEFSHPPLWPIAVDDYTTQTGSINLVKTAYPVLVKQIAWFEAKRKAEKEGFFYRDILTFQWESGVDEGVRFINAQPGAFACLDATSHVYLLYETAGRWARILDEPAGSFEARASSLRAFIQNELFDPLSGYFFDIWFSRQPTNRPLSFEGIFPLLVGAAAPDQAARVIHEYLLNPRRFFTPHPISTVSVEDPFFELRMWRGPTWNSMTYWAARACLRYGYAPAALKLLEAALDDSAAQFERTGTIWEFYHPFGGHPEDLRRKPHTPYNTPCRDYLGHNPLLSMARMVDHINRHHNEIQ